jgi:hypothetical protein
MVVIATEISLGESGVVRNIPAYDESCGKIGGLESDISVIKVRLHASRTHLSYWSDQRVTLYPAKNECMLDGRIYNIACLDYW